MHAFQLCAPTAVRAVLIGKFPYRDPKQAMGLALSAPSSAPKPQTLTHHVFKHLAEDESLGFHGRKPPTCDLTRWATKAGILLLNASLQVC